MSAANATEFTLDHRLSALAVELRAFVTSLQRPKAGGRSSRSSYARAIQERCTELADRVSNLHERLKPSRVPNMMALRSSLGDLGAALQQAAAEAKAGPTATRFTELRDNLARVYEDFVAQMREARIAIDALEEQKAIRIPRFYRSLLHVGIGVGCVLLYELVFSRGQALALIGVFAGVFAFLEISRRFSRRWNDYLVDTVFGLISRPRERYQTNSATYYLAAILLIALFTPQAAVGVALLVLGVGDPVASIVGYRWGTRRLANDKSLEGSLAFFFAAGLAVVVYGLLAHPGWGLGQTALIAGVAGLVGTVVELFSTKIDDNFSIPVVTALVMTLLV